MPDQAPAIERDARSPLSVGRVIGRSLFFPALGAALAALVLSELYLPRFGIGTVERIAALGGHLSSPYHDHPTAVSLGNSVTLEGMDAAIVERAAGAGWRAENLATSGAGPTEFQILLPKLLEARPDVVILPLQVESLGRLTDLPADKAYAYAYGSFVSAWPADWNRSSFYGISDQNYEALRSTPWQQRLHFRRAPLNAVNDAVRTRFRTGLREADPDNWRDPFEMVDSLRDQRLARHLEQVRDLIERRLGRGDRAGRDEIRAIVELVQASSSKPLLVVLPIHTKLREWSEPYVVELRNLLDVLAEQGGKVADASHLLAADDFADAVHLNAEGRRKYSEFLGQQLKAILASE